MKLARLLILLALSVSAAPGIAGDDQTVDQELVALLRQAAADSDSFDDRFHATVWLTDMSQRLRRRVQDDRLRVALLKNVHYEASRAGLDPALVLSVIEVESNFNPYAISKAGARGLMQIMPFWLKVLGKDKQGESLFDMRTNLRYGCTILKHYLDKEKGDITRALARYNGSRGKYGYPKKVYSAWDKRWFYQ